MQSANGARFLIITHLFLPSNCNCFAEHFVNRSAPAPLIVIVPLTKIYASYNHINFILTLNF